MNIRYPIALAPGKTGLLVFRIKRGRSRFEQRAIDVLERVDTDHGKCLSIDVAGNDGDNTASRADVELGRLRPEDIPRDAARVSN
jgi:hypothetical protein